MKRVFTGRHTMMGLLVFFFGIITAPLVPFCFTLSNSGWIVGIAIFLPLSGYLLWDGARRLTRVRLEFSEQGICFATRFSKKQMDWGDIIEIRATVESDDEGRIILTLHDTSGNKIRIPQGTFRIPVLDEVIRILKDRVARHPSIRVEDFRGVWSGWDDFMQFQRRLHPRRYRARG